VQSPNNRCKLIEGLQYKWFFEEILSMSRIGIVNSLLGSLNLFQQCLYLFFGSTVDQNNIQIIYLPFTEIWKVFDDIEVMLLQRNRTVEESVELV
jgi:hypothetical protein